MTDRPRSVNPTGISYRGLTPDPTTGFLDRTKGVSFRQRSTGGSGGASRTVGSNPNVASALADARTAIGGQFDAEAARLKSEFDRQLAGIGAGAGDAIREAQQALRDIGLNREAIRGVYDQYEKLIDPLAQEAINVAASMVGEVTPELEQIAREAAEGVATDYAEAESIIAEAASLINAGGAAARAVQAEATEMEAFHQAEAAAVAEENLKLLQLEGDVARTAAIAADKLDEGEMKRRALLQDVAFQEMEEQAQAALAAARRAAAAAAARRRAIMAERDEALGALQDDKIQSLKLNPHEAGEVAAIAYLNQNGRNLDYNRQQLVFSTLSNALSEQVSTSSLGAWVEASGLQGVLTGTETNLLRGALVNYTNGMKYQQNFDRRQAAPGSGSIVRR